MSSPACLYIAGIGASAGGLESMLSLFAKLKANGRVAYVVAQHMAHNAHSELIVRLLNRESALPVVLAERRQTLAADTIYLIPAGSNGKVDNTLLLLQPPEENNLSTPSVNALFDSIGKTAGNRAIGLILSGTGRDGALGCITIRSSGGTTLAQQPETTKFNGMPTSAIEAKAVDYVLPIDMIAEHLSSLFSEPSPSSSNVAVPFMPGSERITGNDLGNLLPMVLDATGIDFSGYKEETLLRRLDKRLSVLGLASFASYFEYILRHPDELAMLQRLFLVSLSSFFRDRDSFFELRKPLAELLAQKRNGEAVRIWVPGCASGEEVYTLAIMLSEILGRRLCDLAVSIVGTDINSDALDAAKRGLYRQTAYREIEADILQRYFIAKGHHYQVAESLRRFCRFEIQNVTEKAPLAELDLISCRNLLIYLKSPLQTRIIRGFHRALCPQGLLFVGQAESLGIFGDTLFHPVDHYHKIYRRRL